MEEAKIKGIPAFKFGKITGEVKILTDISDVEKIKPDEVEDKIMLLEKKKKWVITPHFDPYDDEEMNDALLHGKALETLKKVAE